MEKPINPVQLAVVGGPHGVRGEVRVKAFTEDPLALADYGPLFTAQGRALEVAAVRRAKEVVIVRFADVADRDAAEALKGEALFVDRAALPPPLEEDEFYHADLVGLAVLDENGDERGRVFAVHDFGAGDILEIRPPKGSTLMIPFTRDAVPDVDLTAGILRVDTAAAGLGEREEDAAGEGP